MILTITPNPVFETIYYLDNQRDGIRTKATKVIYNISGDGINTSRILKDHNLDVFAMGFLGGLKGQYIFNALKELKIYNDFTFIRDETKGRVIIHKEQEIISIIEEETPKITREELSNFYRLYGSICEKSKLVCGLGDMPLGIPKEIYFDLIQVAKKNNKRFALDTKGSELIYGIEAEPFMVKVDKEDLEEIGRIRLDSENEIINIGHSLIEKGIEVVIIDLVEKGTIVLTKDRGYRVELSNVNLDNINIDKGYLVSGYILGMEKQYDLDTVMKLGQAMRIAYGIGESLNRIYMSDIKQIMSKIEISEISY